MLQATRDKNGVYIEPWRFDQMESTLASQGNQASRTILLVLVCVGVGVDWYVRCIYTAAYTAMKNKYINTRRVRFMYLANIVFAVVLYWLLSFVPFRFFLLLFGPSDRRDGGGSKQSQQRDQGAKGE